MAAKKQAVVVTGGVGYIGSHVTAELIKANYHVVVIDDLSNGSKDNLFEGPDFFKSDFANKALWDKLASKYRIKAVIHLAASIDAVESLKKPQKYLENNTAKTLRLLKILHDLKIGNLIFSSTAAVYGQQIILPIPENATLQPLNPYGESKLIAEKMISYYSKYGRMSSVILRFFNASGTSEEVNVKPQTKSGLIAKIESVVAGKDNQLRVFGNDYDTKDGTCVRDLVHVVDIARAHVAALGYLAKQKKVTHEIFNVGSGSGFTVQEIIQAAEKVTGKKIKRSIAKRRTGEIPISIADVKTIKRQLGFDLQHSDLASILGSTLTDFE